MATLEYWRADNMWAAFGRPDGLLGKESITLQAGASRVFVTDWRWEKTVNDCTNFYGSHGRRLANPGTTPIDVQLTSFGFTPLMLGGLVGGGGDFTTSAPHIVRLAPGQKLDIKADIVKVSAPRSSAPGLGGRTTVPSGVGVTSSAGSGSTTLPSGFL